MTDIPFTFKTSKSQPPPVIIWELVNYSPSHLFYLHILLKTKAKGVGSALMDKYIHFMTKHNGMRYHQGEGCSAKPKGLVTNYRRGGGLQNERGACEVLPLRKGVGLKKF